MTPNVPIIGQTKSDGPDISSLSQEDQDKLSQMAEDNVEYEQVSTAFLIKIDRAGSVTVTSDLDAPLALDRTPSPEDIIGYCHAAAAAVGTQMTAQMTAISMMQMGQQAMQSRANDDLVSRLRAGGLK